MPDRNGERGWARACAEGGWWLRRWVCQWLVGVGMGCRVHLEVNYLGCERMTEGRWVSGWLHR